jgi:dihydroorotate dehydrogenase (NAD+) catalytic subunit
MNRQDAVEFFICGATAIQIGTANFINPNTACEIITGLEDYLRHNRLANIKELTGSLISDRHQLKRYEK